jgi:hypothetical protein
MNESLPSVAIVVALLVVLLTVVVRLIRECTVSALWVY